MTTSGPPFTFPAYLDAVEKASAAGQRRYLGAIRLRLVALVLAAVGGAVSWHLGTVPIFGWLALVGFAATVIIEFYILSASPDRLWYEARAAAESVKTLAWRFAVGGRPFPVSQPDVQTEFRRRLVAVSSDLRHEQIPPVLGSTDLVPSDLLAARASAITARRELYATYRIEDQLTWYSGKASRNARRSQQFLLATLVLEFGGFIAAGLKIALDWNVDLLGIAAALISGVAAWRQTRQYGTLSSAYAVTARELVAIKDELLRCDDADWDAFVERAEEAVSREHTLWRSTWGSVEGRIKQ